jgi:hypothetical protein
MSYLRPLSESVSAITRQSFAKKFVALSRILEYWTDIVGADYASITQPQKLSYRKPKTKDEKPHAILHIMADPSDAASLHYQSDLILERLNQIFGDKWITKIKFEPMTESSVSGFAGDTYVKKTPIPLTPEAENQLNSILNDISDPELRLRLEKLGQGVLRKGLRK